MVAILPHSRLIGTVFISLFCSLFLHETSDGEDGQCDVILRLYVPRLFCILRVDWNNWIFQYLSICKENLWVD